MGNLSPCLFFRVPSPTLAPFWCPLGLWGRVWHRASCQPWGWPWRTQGKAEPQSAARYWYTCQVLPKSEERSISKPAGTGPCRDTQGGGGEGGLSDPAWRTRSQKDALKCWRPLRTPVRREKEGCTEQVGSGALRSDPAGKPRAPAGFPCFCKLTESRSNFQKARSLLSPPPRQSGQKILPLGFLQPNADSVLSSFSPTSMVRAQVPDRAQPGFLQQPRTQARLSLSKPHPHTSPAGLSDHMAPCMRPFDGSALAYFCPQ